MRPSSPCASVVLARVSPVLARERLPTVGVSTAALGLAAQKRRRQN
ncbi:hypothetical protein LXT21_09070 [Myxococcus sp. K38C18041901]|nr:hypothetical protein [Myxococcus guangdongensis]MCP3058921.1 hypothetical protein [Myxococcus guangdongensis]